MDEHVYCFNAYGNCQMCWTRMKEEMRVYYEKQKKDGKA